VHYIIHELLKLCTPKNSLEYALFSTHINLVYYAHSRSASGCWIFGGVVFVYILVFGDNSLLISTAYNSTTVRSRPKTTIEKQ